MVGSADLLEVVVEDDQTAQVPSALEVVEVFLAEEELVVELEAQADQPSEELELLALAEELLVEVLAAGVLV